MASCSSPACQRLLQRKTTLPLLNNTVTARQTCRTHQGHHPSPLHTAGVRGRGAHRQEAPTRPAERREGACPARPTCLEPARPAAAAAATTPQHHCTHNEATGRVAAGALKPGSPARRPPFAGGATGRITRTTPRQPQPSAGAWRTSSGMQARACQSGQVPRRPRRVQDVCAGRRARWVAVERVDATLCAYACVGGWGAEDAPWPPASRRRHPVCGWWAAARRQPQHSPATR